MGNLGLSLFAFYTKYTGYLFKRIENLNRFFIV